MTITIEKHWDGNELVTERGNRIYTSKGRWQWVVIVDGEATIAHDTKRGAKWQAARLQEQPQSCPGCGATDGHCLKTCPDAFPGDSVNTPEGGWQ